MIRSVRRAVMVMMYAVVGAVAGRVAMDLRQRHLRGEPLEVKLDASSLRPQEIVPGLIAAMRVRDRPWSYLHIPGWFALPSPSTSPSPRWVASCARSMTRTPRHARCSTRRPTLGRS